MHDRLIERINRKEWWHVPPRDPQSYEKRGVFLASTFREAEFWGRPFDEPQHVSVTNPLVGDELTIELELFAKRTAHPRMSIDARFALDARMKRAAIRQQYDSIVLMSHSAFRGYIATGLVPLSIELNILNPNCLGGRRATLRSRPSPAPCI